MRLLAPSLMLVLGLSACADETGPSRLAEPRNDAPVSDERPAIELSLAAALSDRDALSGGALTVFDISDGAFSLAAGNLLGERMTRHEDGDEAFEGIFDGPPESENPGLGPVFDNVSCESCHLGDGRGRAPTGDERIESILFRASIPGEGPRGGPKPVPYYGTQLQLRSFGAGMPPDARAVIRYVEARGSFADGTRYELRVPSYTLTGIEHGLPANLLVSPRVAPGVFGLGLLEAVPEATVLALAASQAVERRVSGRPNWVWDEVRQQVGLGRFGWKANNPSLVQQTAGAYNGDMGITSSLFPAEGCEGYYPACARHEPEVSKETVAAVAFYTQTLGVPARRSLNDPVARRGEVLFHQAGCASCHVATLRTGVLAGVPEVSNQTIHPYTDLLVHDMGPGLADNRPDFRASGSEWRTAPLWGVGLIETVNHHTNFLHDGRARNLVEALLWHGGEATEAKEKFRKMSTAEREALIKFLQSL